MCTCICACACTCGLSVSMSVCMCCHAQPLKADTTSAVPELLASVKDEDPKQKQRPLLGGMECAGYAETFNLYVYAMFMPMPNAGAVCNHVELIHKAGMLEVIDLLR